jgi:hypothetical protein
MAYTLNRYDGSPLVVLADGTFDTAVTNLTLIGKNVSSYGTALNENFLYLLENFRSGTAPDTPVEGQLWWDSVSKQINVYQGSVWKTLSHSVPSATAPSAAPASGDLWWDNVNSQLRGYTGSQWVLIGPSTPPGVATTAFQGNAVTDTLTSSHNVGNIIVNNRLAAVVSTDGSSFTPIAGYSSVGITKINPGINFTSAVEPTMISSPNMTMGVSNGNVQINGVGLNYGFNVSANIGGVNTTVFYINGATGTATFSGNVNFPSNSPLTISQLTPAGGTLSVAGSIVPSANLAYNLGSTTSWWNNIYGTAIHAQYADLAERYAADQPYEPGTVVSLGGTAEITIAMEELTDRVFGVISTKAAYLMNSTAGDDITHPPVAVSGRVPVKVIGIINKGDRLVCAGNGVARAGTTTEITSWNVIGRSLENKHIDGAGVIEAVVKLNT